MSSPSLRRPDQDRFDLFSQHLRGLNERLSEYASTHGMTLIENVHRLPSRMLRRVGNPVLIIEINLSEHWRHATFSDDMNHDVGVAAYFQSPQGKRLCRQEVLVSNRPFSEIDQQLEALLERSHSILLSWGEPHPSEDDPDAEREGWERAIV